MNARNLSTSLMTALAVALGTSLALSVSHAQAQELDPKEVERVESTSVGGGFLIGAVVGGPPGAFVGAVAGALVGDRFLVGRKNKALETSLDSTRQELLAMQAANEQLQAQLIASRGAADRNLVATTSHEVPGAACCGDSELVLHFRSGSSAVEELYDEELKDFVGYVQSVPGAVVEIYGFADRRGEQNDNLWLSQERVQSVEKSLRDLGLRNFTYETTALGEGQPATATDTLENNFFDRRVVLRVRKDQKEFVSSSR
jgi:outer membrane protein OmpA-like peptidoglycan-associated protein